MALVMLKDVEVARVNRSGFGVQVVEANDYQGKVFKTRWTVWFKDAHGLTEGDIITVSGFHGDKIGEPYTDSTGTERRSIERSLNNPRIGEGSGKAAPAQGEVWAKSPVAAIPEDDTPF